MNGLAFCAGIGGLELGIRLAVPGYRCVGAVERNAEAAAILARSQEPSGDAYPIWDDLETFPSERYRDRVSLLSAGVPCQPVSYAGQQQGQDDERWLWPLVARHVCAIRPRFLFLECTPGYVRHGLGDTLGDLAELGFDAEWSLFSNEACGAPHRRLRFFLLAWRVSDAGSISLWEESGRRIGSGDRGSEAEPGDVGEKLGDAHVSRLEGWSEPERRERNECATRPSGATLAHSHRREVERISGLLDEERPPRGNNTDRCDGPRLWPPGPSDLAGWGNYTGPEPTEPKIRGSADGAPAWASQLHALGNAVSPVVAAVALRTLADRGGLT